MKKENLEELNRFYRVTTKRFCGGITTKNEIIISSGTAPCFQWAVKRKMIFQDFVTFLKQKGDLINIQRIKEN